MNATSHFELLKLKSAEQKKKTALELSTNSSDGSQSVSTSMKLHRGSKVRAKEADKKRHEETKLLRPTNLVPANTVNKMAGEYRTGMGDTPVYYRPGSLDFLACPSRGMPC